MVIFLKPSVVKYVKVVYMIIKNIELNIPNI